MDDNNRVRIEVEVDGALLRRAEEAGLDVAGVFARSLRDEVSRASMGNERALGDVERLREEVRADVEWYNGYTAQHGLFADRWRRF